MNTTETALMLGFAKIRAAHILKLIQLFEDGEIGRDGMLESIRHEATAITEDNPEP